MKYFILAISLFVIENSQAQNKHFTVNEGRLTWKTTFKTAEQQVLTAIAKNNPRYFIRKNENAGKSNKVNCTCKGSSFYMEQYFDFNFKVTTQNGSYTVEVSDIVFESEGDNNTNNHLEDFVLKRGKNTSFINTPKNFANLDCFDAYFKKHFVISDAEEIMP
ncbi:hypothetical protein [Flavobacterium branchiophilum]|uniref:DUF4468 domain-containing protein n=1 Tax=Flavobacterium branchiophilum TaxID=55197 RepID=A0A2H3L0M3_9FLAO|nr:hypothetical protein [Flavobacterium branchiophilum]PDS26119.1 hypothetical protein B0A77_03285 [Flavobacterium branchiophilum]